MLKKNDLAKQFELLTKQEIKNYQDSLNFILQSIDELKNSVESIRKENSESYAKIHSTQQTLGGVISRVNENLKLQSDCFLKHCHDQEVINGRDIEKINNIDCELEHAVRIYNDLRKKITEMQNEQTKISHLVESQVENMNKSFDDCFLKHTKALLKVKKEIQEAPSQAFIVKKELEEKIASHVVDVSGIIKELNIYKRENYITQKKIENIYTLIERLNNSEV